MSATGSSGGLHVVEAAAVAPTPWRNGGGLTRELLRVDARGGGADDWRLRISLADITADGAFSAFDGVARWFAVVSGNGVRLAWPGQALADRELHAGDAPLHFDGGQAPFCRLVDGPTRDLNVMARRAGTRVEVLPARAGTPWRRGGGGRGVFTLHACTLHRDGHDALPLNALTLAWADAADRGDAGPAAWRLEDARGATPAAFWIGFDETPGP